MSNNIGEEICGDYLKHRLKCDFITYNVATPDVQGEIDVIGINLNDAKIYVCEVATHTGGLQYVTDRRPDDYKRFKSKFEKGIAYAKKYFSNYTLTPMIWSPVVNVAGPKAKYNTLTELHRLQQDLQTELGVRLELIINQVYADYLNELKDVAKSTSEMFSSPVMRFLQIQTKLDGHVEKLKRKT